MTITLVRGIAALSVLLSLSAFSPAAERSLSAASIHEQGVPERLVFDGKSLQLARGVLIEDDGPAAGFSYQPNEEVISGDVWVRKHLVLPELGAAQAYLLVASGGELLATVNGKPVELPTPSPVGNYWKEYELPADVFRSGLNEIVLSGNGKLWIAREDEYPDSGRPGLRHPNRSAKSRDAGKTWDDAKLGKQDNVDGEYYVRLFLEQHHPTGTVTSPCFDIGNLEGAAIAPPVDMLKPVTIAFDAELPQGTRLEVRTRTSAAPGWEDKGWSDWKSVKDNGAVIDKPQGRFAQFQARLSTDNPAVSPQLRNVVVRSETQPSAKSNWWQQVALAQQTNPEVVRSSIPFVYESFDNPQLKKLRQDYDLDAVVSGADDEWSLIGKLAVWSSGRWPKIAHLKDSYPAWNALEILKLHPDGTPVGGFCQQYNTVFLQACESFGIPGRVISMGPGYRTKELRSGHEAVEIWSNEHDKWVYFDGQFAWYAKDAATKVPLSMRELRERQLTHLAGRDFPPVEVVHLLPDGKRWENLGQWPVLVELRLIPRSNFLAQPSPLPLNQGMRGWFWTGHQVWADDLEPRRRIYSDFVERKGNWDWTPNRVHATLIAAEEPGKILVRLDTDTPALKHVLVGIDREPPLANETRSFTWTLKPGRNDLSLATVNGAGRVGPLATIVLNYGRREVSRAGVQQIVAHRGSSAEAPECTLAAIGRAMASGATAVEVDVRTTKDGALVILHDATLDRTTSGSGPVTAKTLAEIRALDAGSWFDAKFAGEKVPTLAEVCELCKGRIDVLLDLKEQGDEYDRKVAELVKRHGDPKGTIVGARSVAQAKRFRELLPESQQLGLIPAANDIEAFAEAGVETIRIWPKWLTANPDPLVARVRKAGAKLHLNGTTGDREEVSELLIHSPESMSSDDPARLTATLQELAKP